MLSSVIKFQLYTEHIFHVYSGNEKANELLETIVKYPEFLVQRLQIKTTKPVSKFMSNPLRSFLMFVNMWDNYSTKYKFKRILPHGKNNFLFPKYNKLVLYGT